MAIATHNPIMIERSQREASEQAFVVDLKKFIASDIDPICRELADTVREVNLPEINEQSRDEHIVVRKKLEKTKPYRDWVHLMRTAQDMMWDSIATPLDRQLEALNTKADIKNPRGSVTVDPDFTVPRYLTKSDVHRMPGGYAAINADGDVRQGAMYDLGGFIYHMGGNNGTLNDARGHTLMSHIYARDPDFNPQRILEMGCSAGNSSVAISGYLAGTEMHSIDASAGLVNYAHARAESMGATIHFSQQDAAATNFEDSSFDMVCSCVMLHETSKHTIADIFSECYRLLKPGGLMVHLEVPYRYEDLDLWGRIRADYEGQHNKEPFWRGFLEVDLETIAEQAGFIDRIETYQDVTRKAERGGGKMREKSLGVHRSWYIYSAIKPK